MKTELKAKFLQHLTQKKKDEGFTLIELLVVIIIIGILSAIALPSFLNQASKAKESEAKTNAGAVNRAQQAYRLENPQFASSIGDLKIGIQDSANYSYDVASADATGSQFTATPATGDLRAFSACVKADPGNSTTSSSVEVADAGGASAATPPDCP